MSSGDAGPQRPVPPTPPRTPAPRRRSPVWAAGSTPVHPGPTQPRLGQALAAAGRMVGRDWRRLAVLVAVTSAPGLALAGVAWRRLPPGDIDWFSQALRAPADARQAVWFAVVALLLGRMVLVAACTWTYQARRVARTPAVDRLVAAGMRGDVARQVAPGPMAVLAAFALQQFMLRPDRGVGVVVVALLGAPGLLLVAPLLPLVAGLWWLRTVVWLEHDGEARTPGTDGHPQLRMRDLMRGHTSVVWGWSIVVGVLVWGAMATIVVPVAGGWPVGPLGWLLALALANVTVPVRVAAAVQLRERILGSSVAGRSSGGWQRGA